MTTARLLTDRPQVRFRADGKRELLGDLRVDLGERLDALHGQRWATLSEAGTTIITVPKGFVYDGASIPWFTAPIMGPKERYEIASVVHDFLYRQQAPRGPSDNAFWIISRSGIQHVGAVLSWFGWLGLRIGGWWAYWRNGD